MRLEIERRHETLTRSSISTNSLAASRLRRHRREIVRTHVGTPGFAPLSSRPVQLTVRLEPGGTLLPQASASSRLSFPERAVGSELRLSWFTHAADDVAAPYPRLLTFLNPTAD